MKRQIVGLFLLGLLRTVSGCATDLSAAGQGVRLGKIEPGAPCKELGIVRGSGGGGGWTSTESKMDSAQNEIRNRAAEMGGNYVVMDVMGGDALGMTLSGRAYSCPPGGPTPNIAPQQAPAAASGSLQLTPEERLKRLQDLLNKGLITQQEYESRRREILQSL